MSACETPKPPDGLSESDIDGLDPETITFLKSYLAIPDEDLKAHVRRLVEEIRRNPKKKL